MQIVSYRLRVSEGSPSNLEEFFEARSALAILYNEGSAEYMADGVSNPLIRLP